jgi:hypothetical protein
MRKRIAAARANDLTSEQLAIIHSSLQMVQRRQFSTLMQTAIDDLNRSQISVYSVDARGLMTYDIPPKRRHSLLQRTGRQLQYSAADVFEPQDFLVSLASSTGGLPFLNNNDLNRGLKTAYRDASEYYLIAYQPNNERELGKYHKIKIALNRQDLKTRYRKGYIEKKSEEVVRSEVYTALTHPWMYDKMGLFLEVNRSGNELSINTHFPTKALTFSTEGENLYCPLETYGILVDQSGKWVKNDLAFAKQHHFRIPTGQLEEVRKLDYVTSAVRISAPAFPGQRLIVVVRQGPASQIAADVIELSD